MAGMREVYRAGWLKKITSDDKKKTFKNPRVEKVWMVFCVHDEQAPFLEQYGSRQLATGHQPDFAYPLAECYHVSASIRPTVDTEHEFVITLRQDVVKFSSSRREVSDDWISILRNQLHELKVLESTSNLYTKAPRQLMQFGLQRDPNSPLPAPPPLPVLHTTLLESAPSRPATRSPLQLAAEDTHTESLTAAAASVAPPEPAVARRPAPSVPVSTRAAPPTPPASPPAHWERFDESPATPPPPVPPLVAPPIAAVPSAAAASVATVYTASPTPPTATATAVTSCSEVAAVADGDGESRHVTVIGVGEALLLTVPDTAAAGCEPPSAAAPQQPARLPATPQETLPEWRADRQLFGPAAAAPPRPGRAANLYERLSEASSPTMAGSAERRFFPPATVRLHTGVQRSHSSVPQQRPVPRPPLQRQTSDTSLDSRGVATAAERRTPAAHSAREGGRQLSLRDHQVMVLRREIAHRPGVRMMLPRRTAIGALALADGFGAVWLCGWRWKDQPALSCALHVGDRISSVAGVPVTSAAEFARVVKQQPVPVMELVVQRMPHAMVIAMKREPEGQALGLVRDGSTGEVFQVLPDGLAASHGLPARSGSADGTSLCNWYITEVNSRAVSLFSKGGEVSGRLAAVGREISLVVQPTDLVTLLKRHLKTMRGYKQYVVQ